MRCVSGWFDADGWAAAIERCNEGLDVEPKWSIERGAASIWHSVGASDATDAGAFTIPRADASTWMRAHRPRRTFWIRMANSPLRSLWDLHGISARVLAARTWKSVIADHLFGHAAELGFYFL